MSGKVFLAIVAAGLMLTATLAFLNIRPAVVIPMLSGTNAFDTNFMNHKSMLYIQYGDGRYNMYNSDLLQYVRSQISWQGDGVSRVKSNYPLDRDFSQVGQSKVIDQLLKKRTNGFYVECGADTGVSLSNSLFFERAHNWTGLLIEPNPNAHRQLLAVNRKAYVLKACLSAEAIPGSLKLKLAGVFGGISNNMVAAQNKMTGNAPEVEVQCYPLNTVLAALNINHIDYFSLDVEGAEQSILQTIDWSRLKIDILTIEYQVAGEYGSPHPIEGLKKLTAFRHYFLSTGMYNEIGFIPRDTKKPANLSEIIGMDVIFARKDLPV